MAGGVAVWFVGPGGVGTFWVDEEKCSDEVLKTVFSSGLEDGEEISMFEERVRCLREAGRVLEEVSTDRLWPLDLRR